MMMVLQKQLSYIRKILIMLIYANISPSFSGNLNAISTMYYYFFFLSCGIAVVNNRLDALFVCIKYLPEEGLE